MNQALALELMTQICATEIDNDVDSVAQDNQANGADNAAQTNDFSVIQSSDLNNDCNEFENGDNTVFCDIDRFR